MDNCKTIEQYKKALVDITNQCGLCIGTAYYVAKDFLTDLEKTYVNALNTEILEGSNEQKVEKMIGNPNLERDMREDIIVD